MSAAWHKLVIRALEPSQKGTFNQLKDKIGAIPAATELGLEIQQSTIKTQKGASLLLRQQLYRLCTSDPLIVWCSLEGPRATYYQIR